MTDDVLARIDAGGPDRATVAVELFVARVRTLLAQRADLHTMLVSVARFDPAPEPDTRFTVLCADVSGQLMAAEDVDELLFEIAERLGEPEAEQLSLTPPHGMLVFDRRGARLRACAARRAGR